MQKLILNMLVFILVLDLILRNKLGKSIDKEKLITEK